MDRRSPRRDFLKTAGGVAAGLGARIRRHGRAARATPAEMQRRPSARWWWGRISPVRVKLDLPPLIENGNAVRSPSPSRAR